MRQLDHFEQIIYALGIVTALVILAIVGGYWWSNSTPMRPRSVAADAVFLRAPTLGTPGAPRGRWFSCWERDGRNYCRLSEKNGASDYEGEFVSYIGKRSVPASSLQIDPSKTSDEKAVWMNDNWVPFAYLRSGEVLVPAVAYDEAKRRLEKESQSR